MGKTERPRLFTHVMDCIVYVSPDEYQVFPGNVGEPVLFEHYICRANHHHNATVNQRTGVPVELCMVCGSEFLPDKPTQQRR